MNTPPRFIVLLLHGAGASIAAVLFLSGCSGHSASADRVGSRERLVAHGRYLVHEVAMCIDCHSPRDERGAFIEERHLAGTPLGFAPTVPMPWAPVAPPIAGLPGYTDEQAVVFFTTGRRPNDLPATLPPMPPYKLSPRDAEAVVAYLRSLAL